MNSRPSLFSLPLTTLLKITLFFALALLCFRPIADYDVWYHVETGEWIARHGRVPKADPFSFTKQGERWVAHEWLSQLSMYAVYRLGVRPSFAPLLAWKTALVLLCFFLVYQRCRRLGAGLNSTAAAIFLAALLASSSFTERPHLYGLLFFSLLLYLLEHRRVTPWRLALLSAVWVNLHSSHLLLYPMLLLHGYCLRRPLRETAAAVAACLAASLVNPWGPYALVYPFTVAFHPAHLQNILEWQSPDFHLPQMLLLELGLMLPVFFLHRHARSELGRYPLFLYLLVGHLSLQSVRHIPLFAVAMAPFFAKALSAHEKPQGLVIVHPLHTVLLVLFALVMTFHLPAGEKPGAFLQQQAFPVQAVEFLRKRQLSPHLLTTYDWGGYAIFHLYPDYLVFIDGRMDLYADDVLKDYLDLVRAGENAPLILTRYQVGSALLPSDSLLARELTRTGWEKHYEDEQSVILAPPQDDVPFARATRLAHTNLQKSAQRVWQRWSPCGHEPMLSSPPTPLVRRSHLRQRLPHPLPGNGAGEPGPPKPFQHHEPVCAASELLVHPHVLKHFFQVVNLYANRQAESRQQGGHLPRLLAG